jgi:HD-like signal output (HDOD) protein
LVPDDSENLSVKVAELIQRLPPLDLSVDLLLRRAAEGRAKPSDVAAIVATDPGLCANLLWLANASCMRESHGKSVETIHDALDIVAVETLAELVGTAYAVETVRGHGAVPHAWDAYIAHSRDIAAACMGLAEIRGLTTDECDRAALAGLTHDVGRVVMMAAAGDIPISLLGTPPEAMRTVLEDERRAYGLDHCRIGETLFHKWGFSNALRQGILRHHTPLLREDFSEPGGLIFVAHFVNMSDFTGEILAKALSSDLLARLSVTVADIERTRVLCAARRN